MFANAISAAAVQQRPPPPPPPPQLPQLPPGAAALLQHLPAALGLLPMMQQAHAQQAQAQQAALLPQLAALLPSDADEATRHALVQLLGGRVDLLGPAGGFR